MLFLESPSQFASVAEWEKWAKRLETFNSRDSAVIAEKKRAARLIELLKEEEALDHA